MGICPVRHLKTGGSARLLHQPGLGKVLGGWSETRLLCHHEGLSSVVQNDHVVLIAELKILKLEGFCVMI